MSDKPVSVILTTYNRINTIQRAVDSILNQTYTNIELIIVDDHSTDGTFELISELYGEDDRILYIINETNMGPSAARNTGVNAAHGEWIAFHDSDDVWHPDKLEKQMSFAEKAGSEVGMIYCQFMWYWSDGSTSIWPPENISMKYKSGDILMHVLISPLCSTQTMLIRKQYFQEMGGFATDIHSLEDYEFSIRFSKKYQVLLYNEPLVKVYETANSVGKQNDEKIRVQCLIMQAYKDDFEKYGLRELKMRKVWNEAKSYGNINILEDNIELWGKDEVYLNTFTTLENERHNTSPL